MSTHADKAVTRLQQSAACTSATVLQPNACAQLAQAQWLRRSAAQAQTQRLSHGSALQLQQQPADLALTRDSGAGRGDSGRARPLCVGVDGVDVTVGVTSPRGRHCHPVSPAAGRGGNAMQMAPRAEPLIMRMHMAPPLQLRMPPLGSV